MSLTFDRGSIIIVDLHDLKVETLFIKMKHDEELEFPRKIYLMYKVMLFYRGKWDDEVVFNFLLNVHVPLCLM